MNAVIVYFFYQNSISFNFDSWCFAHIIIASSFVMFCTRNTVRLSTVPETKKLSLDLSLTRDPQATSPPLTWLDESRDWQPTTDETASLAIDDPTTTDEHGAANTRLDESTPVKPRATDTIPPWGNVGGGRGKGGGTATLLGHASLTVPETKKQCRRV